jgi:hypothetical protein
MLSVFGCSTTRFELEMGAQKLVAMSCVNITRICGGAFSYAGFWTHFAREHTPVESRHCARESALSPHARARTQTTLSVNRKECYQITIYMMLHTGGSVKNRNNKALPFLLCRRRRRGGSIAIGMSAVGNVAIGGGMVAIRRLLLLLLLLLLCGGRIAVGRRSPCRRGSRRRKARPGGRARQVAALVVAFVED